MKLSKRQTWALKKSIKKWEDIKNVKGSVDGGCDNCQLCILYNDNGCKACPVALKVVDIGCSSTPYFAWQQHFRTGHNSFNYYVRKDCDECKKLCNDELDFLKSILEEAV